jgi:cytochrome P450
MLTLRDIPAPSSGGIGGHALDYRRDGGDFFVRAHRECGDLARLRFFHLPIVSLGSPVLLHEMLVERARSFEKSLGLRMVFYALAGKGLFTSEGELWKRQRKLMAPLFQPAAVRGYADLMNGVIARYLDGWRDGEVIDAGREMTRLTMAVAGKVLLDADMFTVRGASPPDTPRQKDSGSLRSPQSFDEADTIGAAIQVMMGYLGDQAGSPALVARASLGGKLLELGPLSPRNEERRARAIEWLSMPLRVPTAYSRRVYAALATLDAAVQRLVDERRRGGHARADLLSRLLAARDEDDGSVMTDRQVRDEALTLFIAGHETTATGSTWSLSFLTRHPAVYRRWKAEAAALGGSVPTAEDAPRLGYTLGVFKEALRLYPPVFALDRVAVEDVVLGGHAIPRGTILCMSPYALHRRPDIWPDPERFDPDRFTPEAEALRPRFSWFPFGGGPRVCIGAQFAQLEAQLLLAQIAQRFDLEPVSAEPVKPSFSMALRPAKPLLLRVRRVAGARAAA